MIVYIIIFLRRNRPINHISLVHQSQTQLSIATLSIFGNVWFIQKVWGVKIIIIGYIILLARIFLLLRIQTKITNRTKRYIHWFTWCAYYTSLFSSSFLAGSAWFLAFEKRSEETTACNTLFIHFHLLFFCV